MAVIAFTALVDGEETTSEVDVTFDASRFSLREMVRVEDALGEDMAERFLQGELKFTPRTLQALLWAKLATVVPEVGLDDFDLPGVNIADLGSNGEVEAG